LAERLNFGDRDSGAIVACVVNDGPADKAGLRAGGDSAIINGQETAIGGDLIVAIDGKEVKGSEDVAAKVLEKQPGDSVKITIVRGKKTTSVNAKLGSRPNETTNNCSQAQPDTGR
ncbi:MAG: PDZ domain-containing protein, partial [Actinobacteria bacterium]|nr:PDZ domain-containing protein [Actinomycetota bacterium]